MVRGIHPPILTDRGLVGAVRAPAASSGLTVAVEDDGLEEGVRAPAAVEAAAYFVVAEPLTNAAKYSGSPRAEVGLARTRRGLVRVRDEGRGGADETGGGSGLLGMRRRVAALGGVAVRVVIAEDNALLREGLVLLLTSSGHEVAAVVGTGPEILPALLEHRPDVAVLDVRMPPGFRDEGLRAARVAREKIPGLPVLVLSQYVEESYAAELLGGGAGGLGYLLKDRVGRVDEFLDALERVAGGGTALDPEVVTELLTRRRDTPLDALTPREREVLKAHPQVTRAAQAAQ
ncbi:hypothetical protein SNL152K_5297 [Streptomyces sp. NL15-2K]|nr:hypothetical protein SNL152K_5297 [Streptomyces sp. NL15-2K]